MLKKLNVFFFTVENPHVSDKIWFYGGLSTMVTLGTIMQIIAYI